MTTAVLIAKSMQKAVAYKKGHLSLWKKLQHFWRQWLLWSPHKGNIILFLHLAHAVFGTQRQYVKESFHCLMFSLTPVGKQWRSRTSKPLGSSIITLCHTSTSDRSALLVWFCTAASGTDAAPHWAGLSPTQLPPALLLLQLGSSGAWALCSSAEIGSVPVPVCLAFCSLGVVSQTHRRCPSAPLS